MKPQVTLCLLTMNQADLVVRTLGLTLNNTGAPFELTWVDNGSEASEVKKISNFLSNFNLTASCLFPTNTGVPRGFNTALALARTEYVIMLAGDIIPPDNWLKTMLQYAESVPSTGVVCMYSYPMEKVPERHRDPHKAIRVVNGLPILEAMPMELMLLKRELLSEWIGYLREDFGLYGWCDVEWGLRAERVLKARGLLSYVIPNVTFKHFSSEACSEFRPGWDSEEHWEWKKKVNNDPKNFKLMEWAKEHHYPFYSPF